MYVFACSICGKSFVSSDDSEEILNGYHDVCMTNLRNKAHRNKEKEELLPNEHLWVSIINPLR